MAPGGELQALMRDALREKGYRLTGARKAILAALVRSEGHISADELAKTVRLEQPGIGRMTVYRTLDLLTELGMVRPLYYGTAAARYILLEQGHHHHLICSICNRVIDIDQCAMPEMQQLIARRFDFEIEGHLLEIYGRCRECRA